MRVAIPYEDGQIFQHFGQTQHFKVYEIEGGAITSAKVVGVDGAQHIALLGVLADLGANVLVCGGIGSHAVDRLKSNGVVLYTGNAGSADAAAEALAAGTLPKHGEATHICHHHGND